MRHCLLFFYLLILAQIGQAQNYQIETVSVGMGKNQSGRMKSPAAFFTIAWSDITNAKIPDRDLNFLIAAWQGFGDKKALVDLFLRNLLFNSGKSSSDSRIRFPFPESDFFPEGQLPDKAGANLFIVHRALCATQNFNHDAGDAVFTSRLKSIPQTILEENDQTSFESLAEEWRNANPTAYNEVIKVRDSLLVEWERLSSEGYPGFRMLMLTEANFSASIHSGVASTRHELLSSGNEWLNSDPEKFISDSFRHLLNRHPDPYELFFLKQRIAKLSPEILFLSIMTSDEYFRY